MRAGELRRAAVPALVCVAMRTDTSEAEVPASGPRPFAKQVLAPVVPLQVESPMAAVGGRHTRARPRRACHCPVTAGAEEAQQPKLLAHN